MAQPRGGKSKTIPSTLFTVACGGFISGVLLKYGLEAPRRSQPKSSPSPSQQALNPQASPTGGQGTDATKTDGQDSTALETPQSKPSLSNLATLPKAKLQNQAKPSSSTPSGKIARVQKPAADNPDQLALPKDLNDFNNLDNSNLPPLPELSVSPTPTQSASSQISPRIRVTRSKLAKRLPQSAQLSPSETAASAASADPADPARFTTGGRKTTPTLSANRGLNLRAGMPRSGNEIPSFSPSLEEPIQMKDTSKHWARYFIDALLNDGVVQGYPDRRFRPDAPISPNQFNTMVVNAFGDESWSPISFKDLQAFVGGRPPTRAEAAMMVHQARLKANMMTVTDMRVKGDVNAPGRYSLAGLSEQDPKLSQVPTISRAIEQAGGSLATADLTKVQIRRVSGEGRTYVITLNLKKPNRDIILEQGDEILVPSIATAMREPTIPRIRMPEPRESGNQQPYNSPNMLRLTQPGADGTGALQPLR